VLYDLINGKQSEAQLVLLHGGRRRRRHSLM